ncbi:hypothetical protein ACLQ3C_19850 [Gordonia sp. DT30]|uniref:hypothetical protein n=1 Tax=unclassified Gordonia (in: high G+C Gram-positive bacteria) TaxID=2657482 RepID=UPI003CEFC5CE
MADYAAIIERAAPGWSIFIPELNRHTWAADVREVEEMARDLVQVMTDEPVDDISVAIKLPR